LEEAKFPNDEFSFDSSILTYLEDRRYSNASIDHYTASQSLELELQSSGSDFVSPVAIDAANTREDSLNFALEEFFKDSTACAPQLDWDFDCLDASLMEYDAIDLEQAKSRVASPEVSSQQDLNPTLETGKLSLLLNNG
jgi:hypothetical protein